MSDTEKNVAYGITADDSGFAKGMQQAASAATNAAKTIDGEFKKIGNTVDMVNKYMLGFVSVLAGGGALKKFISDANEWNGTAGKMASQLGISTEKASVLNVALKRLGLESDTYLDAAQKLSKSVQSNGQAFEVMGIKVRDAQGNYKPVGDLMDEVNKKLAAIKNPIEQNIAGQQIYGKGWSEVRGMLKLTSEQMEASEKRARELGLIVGPEGVALTKQYGAQMRELNLVGKSIEIQFGNQMLPVFQKVGAFMAQEGPAAGKTFGLVLEGITFAASSAWLALKDMGDGIGALAAQSAALLSGDIEGFKAIGRARDEEAAKNEAAYEKLKKQFGQPMQAATLPDGPDINKGNPNYHFKEPDTKVKIEKEKSRAPLWEAELAEQKAAFAEKQAAAGTDYQFSKQQEKAFWAEKLALTKAGTQENIVVRRKAAELTKQINEEEFQNKLGKLDVEAAAYKTNTDARLEILGREADLVKQHYGEESKQYQEVQKKIVEIKRQATDQLLQVDQIRADASRAAALADIQMNEQLAQLDLELHNINTNQLLAKQNEFEQQRYAILMRAQLERLQLAEQDPDRNPVLIAQIHAQMEQLEQQHQAKLGEIRRAAALKATENSRQVETEMLAGFQSNLANMMKGQATFASFITSTWQAIQSAVANVLAKMLIDYFKETAAMAALKKALAIFDIGTDAARAGAGAAASAASTPVIGWLTAPVAAAATYSMAAGFAGNIPQFSASGGFDIPSTINPLVQAHASEMILPAKHADVIRNLADNGGAGGQGGGEVNVTIKGTAMPGNYFMVHRDQLMAAIKSAKRDFAT